MNHHGNIESLQRVQLQESFHDVPLSSVSRGYDPAGQDQGQEDNNQSPFIDFQQELRHSLCQLCREIQTRIYRSITIRGLPRLFHLRRLFCLYWIIVVCLLIFLKLYFPLYLTSTVSRNTLEEFRGDWCRVRAARNDWYSLLKSCENARQWQRYPEGWSSANNTDAVLSYVSAMNIKEAGDFSRFSIQAQTSDGRVKHLGGDSWRVLIHGPSSFAPTIIDHNNGTYEILFLVIEPGDYTANVVLDYTLCEGYKDPPDNWFIAGNIHGAAQLPGILGSHRHFLNQPLWHGVPLTFHVPPARGPLRKDEFLSYGFGSTASCGDACTSWLWDGYGRWANGTWVPFIPDNQLLNPVPRRREGVLWIYGDSNALRLHKSIKHRHLCTSIFAQCGYTYNWIYTIKNATFEKKRRDFRDFDVDRVVNEIKTVLSKPQINNTKSALILNFGLHFISAIPFESFQKLINRTIDMFQQIKERENGFGRFHGDLIWKSTTSMNREKIPNPHYIGRRFMTRQRILLFNAYASWAMCRAGIKILDVYPISASFPGGTGLPTNIEDSVHYKDCVFESMITALENYYGSKVYFEEFTNLCYSRMG